eukprot:gene1730-1026_t
MGGPMPPMGGMPANPAMLNPLSPPMPVPPMGQPMMPPQPIPMQQGAGPVAPQARSNAGRRKRFGDTLETMLAGNNRPAGPVASDQMAGMNVFTGQMPRRQMPRGQMMGGTAMQPPVRRMMGGGPVSVPRETDIYGQPHMLAYINPEEADLLQGLGGMGTPGPGGVPQYNWFTDFISDVFSGGSSNTGGRNEPRGSSSSSSQSYTQPSNDPYSEDRGGSTKNANQVYADSMKAGGGGTNLSGSGSSAMADLVAAQQAQTQKDDDRPSSSNVLDPFGGAGPDITPTTTSDPLDPFGGAGPDVTSSSPTYGIPGNTEGDPFDRPPNTGVVGGYDPIGGGSVDDVGIGQPIGDPGDASNINIFTTPIDIPPVGDPDDASNIDILNTGTPIVGDPDDADNILNLEPPVEQTYYDMFGNAYKTQAEAAAADAEHLRKQQAAADAAAAAEAERKRMEQFAQLEAQAAADAERAEAARRKIAQQAAAEAEMGLDPLGGASIDMDYLDPRLDGYDSGYRDFSDPRGDEANVMTNYLPDDPINEGLGKGVSLDKEVKDGGDDEEDEELTFLQKFAKDFKAIPGNMASDFQMALDAGLLTSFIGGYPAMEAKLLKVKNPDGTLKYTPDQVTDYINRTKDKQALDKKNAEEASKYKSTTEDGTVGGSTPVVDPCPEGMRLDPVAGICVPVEEEEDTEEDGTDEKEDTSDDELSGVVTTPPPPTSYLDNPIRAMNRGGSVGLNRAADNFLAAMGG